MTEVQGSAIYTVLLDDGRSVRKHTDQLRARTGITEVRSALVVPGGGAVSEDEETDVPDVPSSAVTTDPGEVDQAVGDPPPPLPPDPVPDITAAVPSDEPDDSGTGGLDAPPDVVAEPVTPPESPPSAGTAPMRSRLCVFIAVCVF